MAEENYVASIQALGGGWYGLQIEAGPPPTPWVEAEDSSYFDRLRTSGDIHVTLDNSQARFTPYDPNLPPGVDLARVIEGETMRKEIEG